SGVCWFHYEPRSWAAEPKNQTGTKTDAKQDKNAEKALIKTPALSKFMRAKLGASQSVLEGLAIEDFDKITEGAKALEKLSAEERWRVTEDPLYSNHSSDFVRIAKKLRNQAEQKNLDGAALSYVQLTMSCIECHRFVRTVLIAQDIRIPHSLAQDSSI